MFRRKKAAPLLALSGLAFVAGYLASRLISSTGEEDQQTSTAVLRRECQKADTKTLNWADTSRMLAAIHAASASKSQTADERTSYAWVKSPATVDTPWAAIVPRETKEMLFSSEEQDRAAAMVFDEGLMSRRDDEEMRKCMHDFDAKRSPDEKTVDFKVMFNVQTSQGKIAIEEASLTDSSFTDTGLDQCLVNYFKGIAFEDERIKSDSRYRIPFSYRWILEIPSPTPGGEPLRGEALREAMTEARQQWEEMKKEGFSPEDALKRIGTDYKIKKGNADSQE